MPDLVALGELLIDFVPTVTPTTLIDAPAFQKAPGGAPANVAVGATRLGHSTAFMGKVGDDAFGHFLADTLSNAGVDVSAMRFSSEARTALAFVSLKPDGDRDFMFYRHPSADMLYTQDELDLAMLRSTRIFHHGSISLIDEPVRSTTQRAIATARAAGALISYDPNLRLPLWPDADAARAGMLSVLPYAHVLKISDEELHFLTGLDDAQAAIAALWQPDLRLMVVTQGADGCHYATPRFSGTVPGFHVAAVDATGAGDGFLAGLLHGLLSKPDALDDEQRLRQVCRFANAVGALTTTRRGAIPALPDLAVVTEFLETADARD